jgi:hypothetical protein
MDFFYFKIYMLADYYVEYVRCEIVEMLLL